MRVIAPIISPHIIIIIRHIGTGKGPFHNLNGENMASHVLYIRHHDGLILRHGHIILRGYEELGPYVHEEQLIGWPESKVFWDLIEGASTGLAPLEAASG